MSKKLLLIAIATLGLLGVHVSEAKVCRLGDTECDGGGFYGTGSGECNEDYVACSDPRFGATYCKDASGSLKYRKEDCCSTLGYEECDINNWEQGYGEQCRGSVTGKTYFQQCGCSYGFAEYNSDTNDLYGKGDNLKDLCGNNSVFEKRCAGVDVGSDKCKFINCNFDRRFVYDHSKSYCKYRLDTQCGGFGCRQVYDCNHDEIDTGKEYYRNDSEYLADGKLNFIAYSPDDLTSNERDSNGKIASSLVNGHCETVDYEYKVLNRYVCNYEQGDGQETQNQERAIKDTEEGFDCGDHIPNYCYLWKGCNNVRKWFNSDVNIGVLYDEYTYSEWLTTVEDESDYLYSATYPIINPHHKAFLNKVNPNHNSYNRIVSGVDDEGNLILSYEGVTLSLCSDETVEGKSCYVVNPEAGCTYVRQDCHQDGDVYSSHRCWKKITCSNENRFYSSFLNAAPVDADGVANNLYITSVNTSYFEAFYSGLENKEIYPGCVYKINNCNDNSGCYRKDGCDVGFEDIRDHKEIETDWLPWFEDIRPICNDNTRCYKATSCSLEMGAYDSSPNTSFFVTINSVATGLTCYKGTECREDAGSYTSTPNTSFFITINSLATGSVCYRGQECYIEAGAYTSTPNEYFFFVENSLSSGSTCYRGVECKDLYNGAYSSTPNTSFFETIASYASGSSCYRGTSCTMSAGSYTSTPNTSFFNTISSYSTGSACYRGHDCRIDAGAYTSTPNTSFFTVIYSLASGSTCYRGTLCNFGEGIYTSTPNTSFFNVLISFASGSTCYRGQECHIEAGAYSSTPNTSFFITINSLSTSSVCYRGQECYEAGGAYTSTPNTSFFVVIDSISSGSICYRGQECYIAGGAYTSAPNTSFFNVVDSLSSGSTCYRGIYCAGLDTGSYTSSPNTSFFEVISSHASGSSCYRGQECYAAGGSYSSSPNTSFFAIINSFASGSACYRGQECHTEVGSYTSTPNTSFFAIINSSASGSVCYRGQECYEAGGAYSSAPNTVFFVVIDSLASGSTCYRGEECAETSNIFANTSFFNMINSVASGSTCYRSTGCHLEAGAYSSEPNTSFFILDIKENAKNDSTCYRGQECHISAGSYTSTPNTSFFITIHSLASGSISYRGQSINEAVGSYTSTPNTSFFITISSHASGSISYRAESYRINAGSYTTSPNTMFFITINSLASGSIAYRGQSVNEEVGAYSSTPNTSFFITSHSHASGSISYRAENYHFSAGSYTSAPNTMFFITINSHATGLTSYRGQSVNEEVGSYSSTPNTLFFITSHSHASGSISYRADDHAMKVGAYTSTPNTSFFATVMSYASGSTAYRAEKEHIKAGAYDEASKPNTLFFITISSHASGSISYRAEKVCLGCGTYTSTPNTSFFTTIMSHASGSEGYRVKDVHIKVGAYSFTPNTSFFKTVHSEGSGVISYRAVDVHTEAGAYSLIPNTAFFNTVASDASGSTCYRGTSCSDTAIVEANKNTSYFVYSLSLSSGSTCYRSSGCNEEMGAYSAAPNTSFFNILSSTNTKSDSTCYRGYACHEKAGAYDFAPNTSFFITVNSYASGSVAYRAKEHHVKAGAYDEASKPNTLFFITVHSHASGSIAYRAESANIKDGAYTSSPNTFFFVVDHSHASGSAAYRAPNIVIPAYSFTPNTSFFITVHSHASGKVSYRAIDTNMTAGAYSSTPNTSFFVTVNSHASGYTAYRAQEHHEKAGAYGFAPNTQFFNVVKSFASGSIAYRADRARYEDGFYATSPNTSFFKVEYSLASGSSSYRQKGVHIEAGAYSFAPNTEFFITVKSIASGKEAYRAVDTNIKVGAYSSSPNELFFATVYSLGSGSTCYRATDCATVAYSSKPNEQFFNVISSLASSIECFRGESCKTSVGARAEKEDELFFNNISSMGNTTCYRVDRCNTEGGAQTFGIERYEVDSSLFVETSKVSATNIECFRADDCNNVNFSYKYADQNPNILYYSKHASLHNGAICYKGSACNESTGYKDPSEVNTEYFDEISSIQYDTNSFCAKGLFCNVSNGAYEEASKPNTEFFFVSSKASGHDNTKKCYRATSCNASVGASDIEPDGLYFAYSYSLGSGSTCYRASGCSSTAESTPINSRFFIVEQKDYDRYTCYRALGCDEDKEAYSEFPNTAVFLTVSSTAVDTTCFRASGCNETGYSSSPLYLGGYNTESHWAISNSAAFSFESLSLSGVSCYAVTGCASDYSPDNNTTLHTIKTGYLNYHRNKRSGTCYQSTGCNADAYTSKPNTSYFSIRSEDFISGTASYRTCYAITGCADGTTTTKPNTNYFALGEGNLGPSGGICYKATSCATDNEAYSTPPLSKYFTYASSIATGKECFRATGCNLSEGAYISAPNRFFFDNTNSYASGSTCYRAERCATGLGAYLSEPNVNFFNNVKSSGSGIECFRAEECSSKATRTPDLSFFATVRSLASGIGSMSGCYRATGCNIKAGAYGEASKPNTLFFTILESNLTDITCYRARGCSSSAVRIEPNTLYFETVSSHATSITCYRTVGCAISEGAYSSEPNTQYFDTSSLLNHPTFCYRVTGCKLGAGAYSSAPNIAFFKTSSSLGTGTECFRAEECSSEATLEPNTTYFKTIRSLASGVGGMSGCYRASSCNKDKGAYSDAEKPNTDFFTVESNELSNITCTKPTGCSPMASTMAHIIYFNTKSSTANGVSTCYRATSCATDKGAYASKPNTEFFTIDSKTLTGSTCYRATACSSSANTKRPNTSFFKTESSIASGLECFRPTGCDLEAGAYSSAPNIIFFTGERSFYGSSECYRVTGCASGAYDQASKPNAYLFKTVSSHGTGWECFRATGCANGVISSPIDGNFYNYTYGNASNIDCYRPEGCAVSKGAYTLPPDTLFFNTVVSTIPGTSDCYRATSCASTALTTKPNDKFFAVSSQEASNSKCFRTSGCASGEATTNPDTNYFNTAVSSIPGRSNCYRATGCASGAYERSSKPDATYFITSSLTLSGSTCYRAKGCATGAFKYEQKPNAFFFSVTSQTASNITCYRTTSCNSSAMFDIDDNYFKTVSSTIPGLSTCYRATGCATDKGAYEATTKPNEYFFSVTSQIATNLVCYRTSGCNSKSTVNVPSPNYFEVVSSTVVGLSPCYRATSCAIKKGAYGQASKPNTEFFTITQSVLDTTCYRVDDCSSKATKVPNTSFFMTDKSHGTGIECFRPIGCNIEAGAYSSAPNTAFFITSTISRMNNVKCYRAKSCSAEATNTPELAYFDLIKSHASGSICYRATRCATGAFSGTSIPDENYFNVSEKTLTGITCAISNSCSTEATLYPNTNYFNTVSSTVPGLTTCYRATGCATGAFSEASKPDESFFTTDVKTLTGSTCYRVIGCKEEIGAYSAAPNTAFFNTVVSSASGIECYRATGCASGTTSSSYDANFFKSDVSYASGKRCYRLKGCADGTSTSKPDENFFEGYTSASNGSMACYKGPKCKTKYSSTKISTSSTPKSCYTSSGTATSCFTSDDVTSWTYINGETTATKYCYKLECSSASTSFFGNYSANCANTSYFSKAERIKLTNGSYITLGDADLYTTLTYNGNNSLTCLTSMPAEAECAINEESTQKSGDYSIPIIENPDDYRRFYTYANTIKTCGNLSTTLAVGCNTDQLSYPAEAFDASIETLIDIAPSPDAAANSAYFAEAGVTKYSDVFTTISPAKAIYNDTRVADIDCQDCVVACACNTAKGWAPSCTNGTNCYAATNKVTMAYKSGINAMNMSVSGTTNIETNLEDLIQQGSEGLKASTNSARSSAFDVARIENLETDQLTCYKPKQSFYNCTYYFDKIGVPYEYDVDNPPTGLGEYTVYENGYFICDDEGLNDVGDCWRKATVKRPDDYKLNSIVCTNPTNASDRVTLLPEYLRKAIDDEDTEVELPTFTATADYNLLTFDDAQIPSLAKSSESALYVSGINMSPRLAGTYGLFHSYNVVKASLVMREISLEDREFIDVLGKTEGEILYEDFDAHKGKMSQAFMLVGNFGNKTVDKQYIKTLRNELGIKNRDREVFDNLVYDDADNKISLGEYTTLRLLYPKDRKSGGKQYYVKDQTGYYDTKSDILNVKIYGGKSLKIGDTEYNTTKVVINKGTHQSSLDEITFTPNKSVGKYFKVFAKYETSSKSPFYISRLNIPMTFDEYQPSGYYSQSEIGAHTISIDVATTKDKDGKMCTSDRVPSWSRDYDQNPCHKMQRIGYRGDTYGFASFEYTNFSGTADYAQCALLYSNYNSNNKSTYYCDICTGTIYKNIRLRSGYNNKYYSYSYREGDNVCGYYDFIYSSSAADNVKFTENEAFADIDIHRSQANVVGTLLYKNDKLTSYDAMSDILYDLGEEGTSKYEETCDYYTVSDEEGRGYEKFADVERMSKDCWRIGDCLEGYELVGGIDKSRDLGQYVELPNGKLCGYPYSCKAGYQYIINDIFLTNIDDRFEYEKDGEYCYKVTDCVVEGYELFESPPNEYCRETGSYGQIDCENYQGYALLGNYVADEDSVLYSYKPMCLKRTSPCPNGYTEAKIGHDAFTYETITAYKDDGSEIECYKPTGCSDGYTRYSNVPAKCTQISSWTDNMNSYIECQHNYDFIEWSEEDSGKDAISGYGYGVIRGNSGLVCMKGKCKDGYKYYSQISGRYSEARNRSTSSNGFIYEDEEENEFTGSEIPAGCYKVVGCDDDKGFYPYSVYTENLPTATNCSLSFDQYGYYNGYNCNGGTKAAYYDNLSEEWCYIW